MKSKTILAVVVASLIAGCGSSGDSDQATTTAPAAATTAAPAEENPDRRAATKIALTQSDFPSGWNSAPSSPLTMGITAAAAQLTTCVGRPDPSTTAAATVNGQTFSKGTTSVSSTSQVSHEAVNANLDAQAMASDKVADCLKTIVDNEVRTQFGHLQSNGLEFASSVTRIDGLLQSERKGNDVVFGWRVTIDMKIAGQNTQLFADFAGFQHGRSEGSIYVGANQQAPDSALREALLSAMYKRALDSGL